MMTSKPDQRFLLRNSPGFAPIYAAAVYAAATESDPRQSTHIRDHTFPPRYSTGTSRYTAIMAGKRKFEEHLAALDALRQLPPQACIEPLQKALANRNNFVVGKAADLIRSLNLPQLIPELLIAFDRFFDNPTKTDPQCWAKSALSRSLATFEYQDATIFLRGMHHIQLEPVWGGLSDTAGALRATCALALVQCRRLVEADLLTHLVELLGDKDKAVRAEVVRAIEQVGSPAAGLLLRLRAILGSGINPEEPEVLGACYGGILRIEGATAIPWIGCFLASADDPAAEAALAIASTHSPQGFETLRQRFTDGADPWFRSVLLSAIVLTRQDAAIEFLLDLVRSDSLEAEAAIEAILRAAPNPDVTKRLEELAAGNPRLTRAFATHRPTFT
jgi:HEAT repeat protein